MEGEIVILEKRVSVHSKFLSEKKINRQHDKKKENIL